MQPYQRATQEIVRQGELPKKVGKKVASTALAIGGTALAGRTLAEKTLALVNKYVPEDIAIKGLNKIDPRFGGFVSKALGAGKSFDEVRDFISQKAGKGMKESEGNSSESSNNTQENRNIIEQYSPELNQFISEKIKGGEDPIKAAALALFQKGTNFESTIRQIEKDHKTNWSQVVQSIFGSQTPSSPQQNQQQPQTNQEIGQGAQALAQAI